MKANVKQHWDNTFERLVAQNQVYAEDHGIYNMVSACAEAISRMAEDHTNGPRFAENIAAISEAFDMCSRLTDIDYSSANKDDVLHGIDVLISELQAIVIRERLR